MLGNNLGPATPGEKITIALMIIIAAWGLWDIFYGN